MSRKLIQVIQAQNAAKTGKVVKVYFDSELSEYVCELWIHGGYYEKADYFTDDKKDAIDTAKAMCN